MPRRPGGARGRDRRSDRQQQAAQGAPALHLGRRSGPPPAHPRRGGGPARPRHPLLVQHLLHQGSADARLRLLAPGRDLLGPRSGRRGDGLGRALRRAGGERGDGVHPRQPPHGPTAPRRHLPRAQPALARPGDRGEGGRRQGGGRAAPGRRDVAPPRQARALQRPEHHGEAARSASPSATSRRTSTRLKVRDSATLVRGRDTGGHYELEPAPRADGDEAASAAHRAATERQVAALYSGTDRTEFRA